VVAKYRYRYFFDAGSGYCLWSPNDEAERRFGDIAVDLRNLPVSENTWRRGYHILAWYDTCIDWSYPPDRSPWSFEEARRFDMAAQELLTQLRHELGADFEIIDESGTGESK